MAEMDTSSTPTDLGSPDDLTERERDAVHALLRTMADDEFVLAERYTEWQVRAPTLESDLAISNIAQDELGHARLWYDLLADFGLTEQDLIWEADPASFRHATFVELPFDVTGEGEWADAILRGYLFDTYEHLHLEALAESSYHRIRDRVEKVQAEEEYHREHARHWLERLCDDDPGRVRVQEALDARFPFALTLFEPTDHAEDIDAFGVRGRTLESIRGDWFDTVVPFLESLGLRVPADEATARTDIPESTGRNGAHTVHWTDLHREFTRTYRELEYTEPPRLMEDPDDAG